MIALTHSWINLEDRRFCVIFPKLHMGVTTTINSKLGFGEGESLLGCEVKDKRTEWRKISAGRFVIEERAREGF